MSTWQIVGIEFDHMHMGDNLRMVADHPNAEIVGVSDEDPETSAGSIGSAVEEFGLSEGQAFRDYRRCLEETEPDIVITCPPPAEHADWVDKLAPYDVHLIVEKPFAASVKEADRMIRAQEELDNTLAINWPQVWQPAQQTTKRLIDEGAIGDLIEVHYRGGNRGSLLHTAGKQQRDDSEVDSLRADSWWYDPDRGGGSLVDYMGYGTTIGTWFRDGEMPNAVVTLTHEPEDWNIDDHSVTVARYQDGLSKFETRWGTFTDPWEHQTQPNCGFWAVGTEGTIASPYMADFVTLQTEDYPEGTEIAVDDLEPPNQNPVQYVIHCLDHDTDLEGPLSPSVSRKGQLIVDAARESAETGSTLHL
jgi:glucose-fructose oxidoreductase